ncbi:MAG: GerMN domain-containing protein [Cyanobacteria bacterium J06555_13]
MRSHNIIKFPRHQKQLDRLFRTAAITLLIIGGAGGLYWQGIYVPSQRSNAITSQLTELTESVEALQQIIQANSPKADESQSGKPAKSIESPPQSYWLTVTGNEISLSPQPLTIADETEPEAALTAAFETLLAGPKPGLEDYTSIPEGTQLLNLKLMPSGVYVDLSNEFSQGGGSSSMISRVAQVLYTATSLEAEADVFLSLEGQPLDEAHPLGGEGLLLAHPLTRDQFAKDFPPYLLKSVE